MSEYFRVLKRMERDQVEYERPKRRRSTTERAPTDTAIIPAAEAPRPAFAAVAAGAPFATLFDNLRALDSGRPLRCLVFAGVETTGPVHAVIAGLLEHVETLGLDVLRAELTETAGRALLRRHRQELTDGGDPLHLDLHGRDWPPEFSDWLRGAAGGPDLALIEGRPLAQSVDAALLARACDGLVIVAQAEVTPRAALQVAADRARAAGCRTLGLVMYGTKNRTPKWIRRLIGRNEQRQERSEG